MQKNSSANFQKRPECGLMPNSKAKKKNPAVLITGVPGTGKSTAARLLSEKLSAAHVDIGKLALAMGLYSGTDPSDGAKVVRLSPLEKEAKSAIEAELVTRPVIADGHLGCEMRLPALIVFVLRCEPKTLRARLSLRGYSQQKIAQNALSEALDYCTVQSEKNYGAKKVWEIDTTNHSPSEVADEIAAIISKKRRRKEKISWPDALACEAILGESLRKTIH